MACCQKPARKHCAMLKEHWGKYRDLGESTKDTESRKIEMICEATKTKNFSMSVKHQIRGQQNHKHLKCQSEHS